MLNIKIPLPALSMNNSHMVLKRGGRIKTDATRVYEEEFLTYLLRYSQDIAFFLKSFDPDVNSLRVDYEFFFPLDLYFTKKRRLNLSKLPDTDNLIKITQDLIFKNIMNDAHVIKLVADKLPTKGKAYISVTIDVIDLPKYEDPFCDEGFFYEYA